MKKLFLMLAVASLSLNAMAQEDPTEKYSVSWWCEQVRFYSFQQVPPRLKA